MGLKILESQRILVSASDVVGWFWRILATEILSTPAPEAGYSRLHREMRISQAMASGSGGAHERTRTSFSRQFQSPTLDGS